MEEKEILQTVIGELNAILGSIELHKNSFGKGRKALMVLLKMIDEAKTNIKNAIPEAMVTENLARLYSILDQLATALDNFKSYLVTDVQTVLEAKSSFYANVIKPFHYQLSRQLPTAAEAVNRELMRLVGRVA